MLAELGRKARRALGEQATPAAGGGALVSLSRVLVLNYGHGVVVVVPLPHELGILIHCLLCVCVYSLTSMQVKLAGTAGVWVEEMSGSRYVVCMHAHTPAERERVHAHTV